MTAKPKQEVAKVEKSTALAVPDFMKDDIGAGSEMIRNEDVELPRILLLQATSPQVTDLDMPPGVFFHTLAEEAMGKDLDIIPVHVSTRFMLWKPRHQGGGILARADDGVHWSPANAEFQVQPRKDDPTNVTWRTANTVVESGLHLWGSSCPSDQQSEPAATKMIVVVALLKDHLDYGPVVLTFQKSSERVAKKLLGKLKMSSLPIFGQVFRMSVTKDRGPTGDAFFNYGFERLGSIEDEATFGAAKSLYQSFKRSTPKVNVEQEQTRPVVQDDGNENY